MFDRLFLRAAIAIACLMLSVGCEQSSTVSGPVALTVGDAPKHGLLGVLFSNDSDVLSVFETVADGPADQAGILAGDQVLEINQTKVQTAEQALKIIGTTKPGDDVVLLIRRDEMELEFNITACDYETWIKLKALERLRQRGE